MLLSIFVYDAATPISSFVKDTNYSINIGFLKCKPSTVFTVNRRSRPKVFCKKDVLKNFSKFTGNAFARVSFLIKLRA